MISHNQARNLAKPGNPAYYACRWYRKQRFWLAWPGGGQRWASVSSLTHRTRPFPAGGKPQAARRSRRGGGKGKRRARAVHIQPLAFRQGRTDSQLLQLHGKTRRLGAVRGRTFSLRCVGMLPPSRARCVASPHRCRRAMSRPSTVTATTMTSSAAAAAWRAARAARRHGARARAPTWRTWRRTRRFSSRSLCRSRSRVRR